MKKRLVAVLLTALAVLAMMAPMASARMPHAPAGPGFGDSVSGGATTDPLGLADHVSGGRSR